jgi:hypothetical protein
MNRFKPFHFGILIAAVLSCYPAMNLPAQNTAPLTPVKTIPKTGTFYSLQKLKAEEPYPPLPFDPFPGLPLFRVTPGEYIFNDTSVDYAALAALPATLSAGGLSAMASISPPSGGGGGTNSGGIAPSVGISPVGTNLTLFVTNDASHAYLTLTNTVTNATYQLQWKACLNDPYWRPGQILTAKSNNLVFNPEPTTVVPTRFFRAVHADTLIGLMPGQDAPQGCSICGDLCGTNLWLEVTGIDANGNVNLTAHDIIFGYYYQLLTATNLSQVQTNALAWQLGPVLTNAYGNDSWDFSIPTNGNPVLYFMIHQAPYEVNIYYQLDAVFGDYGAPDTRTTGEFALQCNTMLSSYPETMLYYQMGGSAAKGLDYTNTNANNALDLLSVGYLYLQPICGTAPWTSTATLRILQNSNYVIPPDQAFAQILVRPWDPDSQPAAFPLVMTNNASNGLNTPEGIAYNPAHTNLILSVSGFGPNNYNFICLTNVNNSVRITNWSKITEPNYGETKLTIIQSNLGGFTRGDMYWGTGAGGVIGKLTADGTVSNLNWVTLSDQTMVESIQVHALCHDETGVFSNKLVAVTGDQSVNQGGNIWLIDTAGNKRWPCLDCVDSM